MTTKEKLEALASNLWWSWNPEAIQLFSRLNPEAFRSSTNSPLAALRAADTALFDDDAFAGDVDRQYERLQQYMNAPRRYGDADKTAYFCMEYGLHESLPIYSGGLGILAGDHAKAASDQGLHFTTIGLLVRDGYFTQQFTDEGRQRELHVDFDPEQQPMHLVRKEDGEPVAVTVHIGREPVELQAWHVAVGRTDLFLLDSDLPSNPDHLRPLTRKLYQGDHRTRLRQEIVLGIGGVRLLRALGREAEVYHMNEGHCAFLTLELLRERMEAGASKEDAEAWVRDHCVFTTHTPVMAGHDRFDPNTLSADMETLREALGLSGYDLLSYGRVTPEDPTETFTMTVLALKMSRQANGVSALNGEVARRQWQHLYRVDDSAEVPIGHITNGIHLPTWASPIAHSFLNEHFGDWLGRRMDPAFWQQVGELSDEELWKYRSRLRAALVDFARQKVAEQSMPMTSTLDPNVLTIGFARRFATYKRAPLLFLDLERAVRLFERAEGPIQMLYAGKAHPADEEGKAFIHAIFKLTQHPSFSGKLVFLENYNMEVGRALVSGCDVWLNNPRRPMEASGTSGQKVSVHGGLNLSILDGWWPEGYNGKNGWTIGQDASANYMDPEEQDLQDSTFLYETLENDVIPLFYDRGADGIPHGWIERVREALVTLPYAFSAERMVADYIEQIYATDPVASR